MNLCWRSMAVTRFISFVWRGTWYVGSWAFLIIRDVFGRLFGRDPYTQYKELQMRADDSTKEADNLRMKSDDIEEENENLCNNYVTQDTQIRRLDKEPNGRRISPCPHEIGDIKK
ncbi:uncharacterized protein LOC127867653 isoform X3 [Dreissena polymorpha]|uniref:uncharacterized protein LOC127867653 isoform X3 n=1 Tax=Dreissena polymorpha TaxID=45954 RepID=UPI0022656A82|nr:uncharacterized protein LOC127867653 isoform X3 [Dreissena polymorpha]